MIVTLQLGQISNFVGAHYWNIQDEFLSSGEETEIQSSYLFREGVTDMGHPTYTPRLVLLDTNASMGSMPQSGYAYNSAASQEFVDLWGGQVQVIRQEPVAKNAFLLSVEEEQRALDEDEEELDEMDDDRDGEDSDDYAGAKKLPPKKETQTSEKSATPKPEEKKIDPAPTDETQPEKTYTPAIVEESVRTWTDFLKCNLHYRTCTVLKGVHCENFENFNGGVQLWGDHSEQFEELEDNVRWFLEECDYVSAIQIFGDATTAAAYPVSKILTHYRDELPKTEILLYSISGQRGDAVSVARNNILRAAHWNEVYDSASMITALAHTHLSPSSLLSLPSSSSLYRTSATHAAAVETSTIGIRTRDHRATPTQFVNSATSSGRAKVVSASMLLPMPLREGESVASGLDKISDVSNFDYLSDLMPLEDSTHAARTYALAERRREEEEKYSTDNTSLASVFNLRGAPFAQTTQRDITGTLFAFARKTPTLKLSCEVFQTPLHIPTSFPTFFAANVGRYGRLSAPLSTPSPLTEVISTPHLLRLHADLSTASWIKKQSALFTSNQRVTLGGISSDDSSEIRDSLRDIASDYEDLLEE